MRRMLRPEPSRFQTLQTAKHGSVLSRASLCNTSIGLLFLGGSLLALLLVWSYFSFYIPPCFNFAISLDADCSGCAHLAHDPSNPTFYDDPDFRYSIEKPVKNWDEKRKTWLDLHPSFSSGSRNRVLMVTGSQPSPCKNPVGDHILLRAFKNKVDYCRIHGYDVFYSNALLHPKMDSYWVKLPVIRAAMLAHPEAEWIWWVDSDAFVTDMEFEIPFERYKNYNLVAHGWSNLIYEKQSWTAVNAGVFLIRNCQWSMDFIDVWAQMGPMSPNFAKWGPIQRSIFKDKMFPESDDQTALIYLLYKEKDKYYDKIYLESEYHFQGYWIGMIGGFDNDTRTYMEMVQADPILRRRHAEVVSKWYGAYREKKHLNGEKGGDSSTRRPFVTHFTGCQPCSGDYNPMYTGESCWNEMIRALNFADNQVMRTYGFVHQNLLETSPMIPLPSHFPDEDGFW